MTGDPWCTFSDDYPWRRYYDADGRLHRTDGPALDLIPGLDPEAVELLDEGAFEWLVHGIRHRTDGPAVIGVAGFRQWWVGGKVHRLDGPAVEWTDGTREWWVGGERHRIGGPAVERPDGSREWWVDGKRHRLDGPAVEWADGTRVWWVNGKLPGERPAVELTNGAREGGSTGSGSTAGAPTS